MAYRHSTPLPPQIFRHEPSVAVLGLRLAAQQDGRCVEAPPVYDFLHVTLFQQGHKPLLVFFPCDLFVPIGADDFLSRRKYGFVQILRPAELLQEVLQISALREAS